MTTVKPTGTQIPSLAGLLAKKAPDTTKPAAAAVDVDEQPAQVSSDSRDLSRVAAVDGQVVAAEKAVKRALAFQVPVDLRDAMRAAAATRRTTNVDVILEAIESNVTRLPDLITEAVSPTLRGSLFRREATTSATPRVQVTVRMAPEHLETIDALVDKVGAPNRTTLLVAALRAHLTK